jgi:hypothetical protein
VDFSHKQMRKKKWMLYAWGKIESFSGDLNIWVSSKLEGNATRCDSNSADTAYSFHGNLRKFRRFNIEKRALSMLF